MEIITLIENHPGRDKRLAFEHGFSLYIDTGTSKILFDTGQSGDFVENAWYLGVDLSQLTHIVLSHGHYDHSGGLMPLLKAVDITAPLYYGKGYFRGKYRGKLDEDGLARNLRFIGNGFTKEQLVAAGATLMEVDSPVKTIAPNLYLFQHFPLVQGYEPLDRRFRLEDGSGDSFGDEIALGIGTPSGLILISGCAHRGIVNMVSAAIAAVEMPLRGIIGGTHLIHCSPDRLDATITALSALHPQFMAVSHCTGDDNLERLRTAFGESFIMNVTGNRMRL